MKRSFTCLLLLCSMGLTGCSLNFQEFTAPDGSYSIKMPGKPTKSPTPGASGEAWEVVTGRWNFGVATVDLPAQASEMSASQASMAIDLAVQGLATAFKASTKSSVATSLNGFQGKEAEYSIPAGPNPTTGKPEPACTAVVRFYFVNSKMFMLMARSSNSITKDTPEVKTFYDSFRLTATASSSAPGGGSPGMAGTAGMSGGMAGMPAGGAMPPTAIAGAPNPAGYPAMPPGANPAGAAAAPPGYPVAGTAPGGYPPAGAFPPGSNPAGIAPAGAFPMPNGTTPLPGGAYPTPAGAFPGAAGTSALPNGTTPMPAGAFPPTAGAAPAAPAGAYPLAGAPAGATPNAAFPPTAGAAPAGITPAGGFNAPAGANPYGAGVPGQPGITAAPTFTGTPVTDETKVAVGDTLQFNLNGNWVDVRVQRVGSNGMVQIRSLTKPPQTATVPRSALQTPPGADDDAVATRNSSETESSGLPNSQGGGLPDSSAAAQSKPRSTGFSKPAAAATESKPESSKGNTIVSLDGASVEELLTIIGKKTEHRRVQAAEKLRDHSEAGPNPDVAKKMLALMETDQLTVRNAVAQALEKWACPEINEAALKKLKGGTTEVRQSMMKILAAHYVDGNAEGIAQCLSTQDDRKVAVETLIAIGEPAQGAVIKMLDHRDSKVKLAACDILKEIGTADAITALTKATAEWTGADRGVARKALKALEARK